MVLVVKGRAAVCPSQTGTQEPQRDPRADFVEKVATQIQELMNEEISSRMVENG